MRAAVLLVAARARMAEGFLGPSGLKRVLSTGSTNTDVTTPRTAGEEPEVCVEGGGGGGPRCTSGVTGGGRGVLQAAEEVDSWPLQHTC
jgi:hypothetical protein